MWKQFWRKWTIDKPADLGDWLWQTFVVELAALLDRLTLRQVIAFIPVVILVVAYAHNIPLPPELMLVGDLLAYIDVFSMILLISLIGRVSTVLYVVRQATAALLKLVDRVETISRRPVSRRRRLPGAAMIRRLINAAKKNDDGPAVGGMAWA
jgi:hypothetical protein